MEFIKYVRNNTLDIRFAKIEVEGLINFLKDNPCIRVLCLSRCDMNNIAILLDKRDNIR